ncbi:MAG TPA: hypothetical protein VFZ59_24275 [Verrucomicrobiae bacterium]|nr:hypothetical protein [Verrucomicrobiae bacterium]
MNDCICISLMTAFLVAAPVPAAETNTNRIASAIPRIQFEEVELTDVIESLAKQADINYVFDPKTGFDGVADPHKKPQPRISLSWTNLTAEQALRGVLNYYDLQLLEIKGTTVCKVTLTNQTVKAVDAQWIQQGTNTIIPLIQMNSVPLDEALRNLAAQARIQITLDTASARNSNLNRSSQPIVSFRWKTLTARQAIAALLENYELLMSSDPDDRIHIFRREPGASK